MFLCPTASSKKESTTWLTDQELLYGKYNGQCEYCWRDAFECECAYNSTEEDGRDDQAGRSCHGFGGVEYAEQHVDTLPGLVYPRPKHKQYATEEFPWEDISSLSLWSVYPAQLAQRGQGQEVRHQGGDQTVWAIYTFPSSWSLPFLG